MCSPEHRHGLACLTCDAARRDDQSIVHALHVYALLATLPDRRDIAAELVHFIFDVGEYTSRVQFGTYFRDQSSGNRQTLVVRDDMEWDVELV